MYKDRNEHGFWVVSESSLWMLFVSDAWHFAGETAQNIKGRIRNNFISAPLAETKYIK